MDSFRVKLTNRTVVIFESNADVERCGVALRKLNATPLVSLVFIVDETLYTKEEIRETLGKTSCVHQKALIIDSRDGKLEGLLIGNELSKNSGGITVGEK